MPLTPSDVQFINKLFDRHLSGQRSWVWLRWVIVITGVWLIIVSAWQFRLAAQINRQLLSTTTVTTTPHAFITSTQPVTQLQLQSLRESLEIGARMHASIASAVSMVYVGAMLSFLIGLSMISYAISHWNHHRRDAILIGLLREKCVSELTPVP